MAGKKRQSNSVFSSAGEALMIGLLVILFVTPFVVATMLTPGYETMKQTTQTDQAVAPQPQTPQNFAQSYDDSTVLGVETETEDEISMLVPKGLSSFRLESYVTSQTDGEFLYSVLSNASEEVLVVENQGTEAKEINFIFSRDFVGEIYVDSSLITSRSVFVNIDPGQKKSVVADPQASGNLQIWAIVR